MKLNETLSHKNFTRDLNGIHETLERAEVKVNFWGTRIITVEGLEGSLSLREVTRRFVDGEIERLEAKDLALDERKWGMLSADLIHYFYEQADELIKNAHWFTRLCNYIVRCVINVDECRISSKHDRYRHFTEKQLNEAFPNASLKARGMYKLDDGRTLNYRHGFDEYGEFYTVERELLTEKWAE